MRLEVMISIELKKIEMLTAENLRPRLNLSSQERREEKEVAERFLAAGERLQVALSGLSGLCGLCGQL